MLSESCENIYRPLKCPLILLFYSSKLLEYMRHNMDSEGVLTMGMIGTNAPLLH